MKEKAKKILCIVLSAAALLLSGCSLPDFSYILKDSGESNTEVKAPERESYLDYQREDRDKTVLRAVSAPADKNAEDMIALLSECGMSTVVLDIDLYDYIDLKRVLPSAHLCMDTVSSEPLQSRVRERFSEKISEYISAGVRVIIRTNLITSKTVIKPTPYFAVSKNGKSVITDDKLISKYLSSLIGYSGISGVIISDENLSDKRSDLVRRISESLGKSLPDAFLALETNDGSLIDTLFEKKAVDYAVLKENVGEKEHGDIEEDAVYPSFIDHIVSKDKSGWNNVYLLSDLYEALSESENICGFVYPYSLTRNAPQMFTALAKYFEDSIDMDVTDKELKITSPKNGITVDTRNIIISGICDNNFPLFMNEKEIKPTSKGGFSISVKLSSGRNYYKFSHKGKTVSLMITYTVDVLKSVYPTSEISAPSGSTVAFSCIARSGSSITGSIGGNKLKFTEDTEDTEDIENEYARFYSELKLPDNNNKNLSLGKLKVTASYEGVSETMYGGNVIVEKKAEYIDGNERLIAEVTSECAETFGSVSDSSKTDTAYPIYHFQPKGAKDYVTGELTYGKFTYWVLESGLRVYKKDCKTYKSSSLESELKGVSVSNNGKFTEICLEGSKGSMFSLSYNVNYNNYRNSVYSCDFNTSSVSFDVYNISGGSFGTVKVGNSLISSVVSAKSGKGMKLTVNLANKGKFFGFTSKINEKGELVLCLRNPVTLSEKGDLSGVTILLDPGHGGKSSESSDAIGTADYKNNSEKEANLNVALQLRDLLEEKGAKVYMTRDKDMVNDKDKTIEKLQTGNFDIFLSVHHNGVTSASWQGPETLYYYAFNEDFAKTTNEAMTELLYTADSSPVVSARGSVYQNVKVLRTHTCPSVLAEIGFMTNADNADNIQKWISNGQTAEALCEAVIRYLKSN